MKRAICLLLSLCLLVPLAACAGAPAEEPASSAASLVPEPTAAPSPTPTTSPTPTPTPTPDPMLEMAGVYALTGMVADGEEAGEEDLALLTEWGLTATLTLYDDGSGVLNLFGEKLDLDWNAKSIRSDGEIIPFTYAQGVLTLEQDGDTLTFTKTSEEASQAAGDEDDPPEDGPEAEEVFVNPFSDVKEGTYYYYAVLWAAKYGLVGGSAFQPTAPCARAQALTFLWRAAGEPEPVLKISPYADVGEGAYYFQPVLWAFENGIVSTASDGKFRPEDALDRAQAVTFLYRAAEGSAEGLENPFTDVKAGDYYYEAALWAYDQGVVGRDEAHAFHARQAVNRAQFITFLYRLLGDGEVVSVALPVGRYVATGMVDPEEGDLSANLEMMEAMGMAVTLDLNADGTGYLEMVGIEGELTWDAENLYLDGEALPYTFDGETLTLAYEDGTSLTFTKR